MAVIAMISAKGSPGVTTTALAMTLSWPRPVLLVEADPAGGDILAGYVRGQMPMDRGLVQVAVSARHNRMAGDFNSALLDLARPKSPVSRVLLSGLADPAQAATVAPVWDRLAAHFAVLGHADTGSDVIVDCGRLSTTFAPLPLIAAADVVLLVVRATLRSASTAKPAIAAAQLGLGAAGRDRLQLIVIEGGEYRTPELKKALAVPVLATMPWRPDEAAALSDGIGRVASSSALMRAARGIEQALRSTVGAPTTSQTDTAEHPATPMAGVTAGAATVAVRSLSFGTSAPGPVGAMPPIPSGAAVAVPGALALGVGHSPAVAGAQR